MNDLDKHAPFLHLQPTRDKAYSSIENTMSTASCQLKSPLPAGVTVLTESETIPFTVNALGSGWLWKNGNMICSAGQIYSSPSTTTRNRYFCENTSICTLATTDAMCDNSTGNHTTSIVCDWNNCLGLTGGNRLALPLAGTASATCTCAAGSFDSTTSSCTGDNYTSEYTLPIKVTKVDPVTKVVVDTKTIAFTSTYNCNTANTCDYSVPYDCTQDNTCNPNDPSKFWVDCDGGNDKTCKFTVQDMTLSATSITLQNKSLNGGNYSSISLQQACPYSITQSNPPPRQSSYDLNNGAGTLSLTGQATATCTRDTTSSCNFQANYSIPMTVTGVDPVTQAVDTPTIAFTSSYDCNEEGTCGYSVPYSCATSGNCSTFTVQDMKLSNNILTLTPTSSATEKETFTLSSCSR